MHCSIGDPEAVAQRCSVKKVFLKMLINSQENKVPESFFDKVAGLRPVTLLKKRLWHRCSPVNLSKSLRTPLLIEQLRWLFLEIYHPFGTNTKFSNELIFP